MTLTDIISHLPEAAVEGKTGRVTKIRVPRGQFAVAANILVHDYRLPLSFLFGTDDRAAGHGFGVHAIFACDEVHEWLMVSIVVPEQDMNYPSLTPIIMAAHWYERYTMDMFGIVPVGHPDPRRLVHHENIPEGTHPLRKDFTWDTKLAHANVPYPMHHVEGEGIYEIPVGPIHAGIIEPGHFRFNVAGERIITLEGKLFFTHKGVEKLMEGKTVAEALPFVERVSCDAAVSHALAFVQAIEEMSGCAVPVRAKELRTLFNELERVTMHIHDLANIAGMGTGYTFMAAQGFRIKERLVRLSERLTGNRFWRGIIVPGGCSKDLNEQELIDIATTVRDACAEMLEMTAVALSSDGLRERLETTGVLPKEAAEAFGAVGLPARASGVVRDVRITHPYAAYSEKIIHPVSHTSGDVYARFMMRVGELKQTNELIIRLTKRLTSGSVIAPCASLSGFGFSAVESWRGEVVCAVYLKDGRIERCAPRDPSFCNWALFGIIGPGNIVPDFPLCNKTLNLSYSGTDM